VTSTIHISALAAASLISALLLWLSHELMQSDLYHDVHLAWRYSIGILCGIVGALTYGLLSGDWALVTGVVALYCPGGALVIVLYGRRSLARRHGRERAQAQAWREEILRGEHDAER
jgi:hypothetical protein